jgi:hypothetical protein
MKIGDLGADSYMYEMDDLDQELHTQSTTTGLKCNMDWDAFPAVKALADATHSTHFASSPSDVITQAAAQSSNSLPFELDLDESTSVIKAPLSQEQAAKKAEADTKQCVTDEFSMAQVSFKGLEDFDGADRTGVQKSDARASKFVQDRQELQGAMCAVSDSLDQATYLKQMKDVTFRLCSGVAAIDGQTFTEPTMFPGGWMNDEGEFVASDSPMGTPLSKKEKEELPCFGVPPSDTIVAETIAMGKCTGACNVAARVEESWCDIESGGKVPSGWTANNFQLKSAGCNTVSCTNGDLDYRDVECGATADHVRSERMMSRQEYDLLFDEGVRSVRMSDPLV